MSEYELECKQLRDQVTKLERVNASMHKLGDEFIWGENNPSEYESEMTRLNARVDELEENDEALHTAVFKERSEKEELLRQLEAKTTQVVNLKDEVNQLRTADDWIDDDRIRLMQELHKEKERRGQNLDVTVNLLLCAYRYEAKSFLCSGWRRMALRNQKKT